MPKRKASQASPKLVPQLTWELRLTQLELLHLRDLFSILLPPEGKQTVSSAVAASEERSIIEAKLWSKVNALCKSAKIPLDDGAPDFVVMMAGAPTLGIFKVESQLPEPEQAGPDGDPSTLFTHPGDTDDGGAPEPIKPSSKKPRKKRRVTKEKAR